MSENRACGLHAHCNSLEYSCLQSIVGELDHFCEFHKATNEHSHLYFEFLQKCYSKQILQILVARKLVLKDSQIPLVLHKHSEEIDFRVFLSCDYEVVLQRLKEFGNVVQKFSMVNVKPFYRYDDVWSCLVNVQIINLHFTNCSDEAVIRISDHCHHLRSLNLSYCNKVSDKGLKRLGERKPPLESLNLNGTAVTFKGVACVLKNIPSVQTLMFDNVPKAICEALGLNGFIGDIPRDKVFNLTNIIIVNKPMRPAGYLTSILEICTSLCPFIEDLTVTEIVNQRQLNLCHQFTKLKVVNLQCSLSFSHMLNIDDFLIKRGDKIHTLVLVAFSLSSQVLINSCPNLKHLTLEYPSFSNNTVRHSVTKLIHLKTFNLHNTVLKEENIKSIMAILSSSPNLEVLNFRVCEGLGEIYDAILSYPTKLKALCFDSSAVDVTFLERVLRRHNNLNDLFLGNCGITPEDHDDLMDIVDAMERIVNVGFSDYNDAIKQLYAADDHMLSLPRQIMKL